MIELLHAPDNVIAISLRGEISAADIGKIKKIFEAKLASQERVGLVVDFADFADATEDAIRQDIKLEMGLMTELDRIAKVAIVTDKK